MRVLLSAYSCTPGAGSEPGIGWNWAIRIAGCGHDVTVVTRSVNRAKIESFLERNPQIRLSFLYCDLAPIVQKVYSLPFGNYAYYLMWQVAAAAQARREHEKRHFDLVQHITWGSFRVPSFMGTLSIPFVFGPVGGGEDTPPKFRRGLGWRGRSWDLLRRISCMLTGIWMGPTYAAASLIVATTQETRDRIPKAYHGKTIVCQAVGVGQEELAEAFGAIADSPAATSLSRIDVVFVGRLLAWKGLHLIIRALARIRTSPTALRLTVIGSGPDLPRLRRLSQNLGVSTLIEWVPWMARDELLRNYSSFNLMAFTSLHDSGGTAALEAMLHGLPVLCLDLGGPGVLLDDNSGKVITVKSRGEDQVVDSIREFLEAASADPTLLRRLSEGARARVSNLTWDANVKHVYREIPAF
jgi:glycosyltransferase involved in cell wall biosynthesis